MLAPAVMTVPFGEHLRFAIISVSPGKLLCACPVVIPGQRPA